MHYTVGKASAIALAIIGFNPSWAQSSTFSAGSEGWTALGDVAGPLVWSATGGNPGGRVVINDAVTGGVTYFVAPASFSGNRSPAIGTNLTFDLMQSYPGGPNQFDASDVILLGAGLTLVFDTATNPANGSWTSYSIPLTSAGWHVSTPTGTAATDAQFQAVMADLTGLRIRAEYQTGPDTDSLDNVTLAIPEPQAFGLMLVGLGAVLTITARRKSPSQRQRAV